MTGLVGLILANGPWCEEMTIRDLQNQVDFTLACDGALNRCVELGIHVDAVVGDLDSVDPEILATFAREGGEVVEVKNPNTNDLSKALKVAKTRGATKGVLVGVHDGDPQHAWANMLVCAEQDMDLQSLTSTHVYRFFCPGEIYSIEMEPQQTFSLFAAPFANNITLTGCAYPMEKDALETGSQGLHNRSLGPSVEVEFSEGRLLMVHPRSSSRAEGRSEA